MKTRILILFFFIFQLQLKAQFYDAGQDPASVKWKQIDTSFFKIVFPSNFENQANELANFLTFSLQYNTTRIPRKMFKIPILLHTQNIVSNGFVTFAPKRSEWYTCPPQDIYAQPWLQQLAIHEYRHVIQVSQLNRSITGLLKIPFGQIGIGAVAGIYLPRWFLEGDAVIAETALSTSGRGRLPSFTMDLKAQIIDKGIFNYNKAIFGSYKDYVPDPYTLGYQLVANAKIKYGADFWDKTLYYIARNPYLGIPFALGFKKYSGKTPNQFYNACMSFSDSLWQNEIKNKETSVYKSKLNKKERFYTDFRFPHYINDSEVVALKLSLDDINRIVKIDNKGNYKILVTPGNLSNEYMCYTNNKIVWAELIPDIRWRLKNYSVLKIYDIKQDKIIQITNKTRYFSPSFSADGQKIATIEIDDQNKCYLLIINALNGEVIKRISSPGDNMLTYPKWNDSGDKIVVTSIGKKGKAILEYKLTEDEFGILIPFDFQEISRPSYFKNFIIYNGISNETDEIFAFDTLYKKKYKVTSSIYGATDPFISEDKSEILYSNYTSNGYRTVTANIDIDLWKRNEITSNDTFKLAELLAKQEKGIINAENIPINNFSIKKYRKFNHLINFHSWAPFSIDANNQTIDPGISLMSHNLLSTSFITLGYKYLTAEKIGKYYIDFIYKAWFPIIQTTIDYSLRKGTLIKIDNSKVPFTFGETNIKGIIKIPLNFTNGKYYKGFTPSISTTIININHNSTTPDNFIKGNINTIDYRLYAYHTLKTSTLDLNPKWGQTLEFNYRHSPFGIRNYGDIASVENYLFFPSFLKHHGFITYTGIQKRNFGDTHYEYSDLIYYPNGIYAVESDILLSTSVKYYFPLLYPDLSLSSILYLKRLDMNVFYGKAIAEYKKLITNMQSFGSEVNSELHLFRFIAPVNLGYRFTYLPDSKSSFHEILFNINFSSIGYR